MGEHTQVLRRELTLADRIRDVARLIETRRLTGVVLGAAPFGVPAGPDRVWVDNLLGDDSLPTWWNNSLRQQPPSRARSRQACRVTTASAAWQPLGETISGSELSTVVVTAARGGRLLARENTVPGLALFAPGPGSQR